MVYNECSSVPSSNLIACSPLYRKASAAAPSPTIAPATGIAVGIVAALPVPTAAVLARDARLEPAAPASEAADPMADVTVPKTPSAPEVTVEKTPSAPEVTVENTPTAPDVTSVARLVATDSTLLARSVATDTTPCVTSPNIEVAASTIWAEARGAATRPRRTIGRTISAVGFVVCFGEREKCRVTSRR